MPCPTGAEKVLFVWAKKTASEVDEGHSYFTDEPVMRWSRLYVAGKVFEGRRLPSESGPMPFQMIEQGVPRVHILEDQRWPHALGGWRFSSIIGVGTVIIA